MLIAPENYTKPWRLRLRPSDEPEPNGAALSRALGHLDTARTQRLVIDGPEPTASPLLLDAIRGARSAGAEVWLETDARAIGSTSRAAMLRNAGLSGVETVLPALSDPELVGVLRGLRSSRAAGIDVVARWLWRERPITDAVSLVTVLGRVDVRRLTVDVSGVKTDYLPMLRTLAEASFDKVQLEIEGHDPSCEPEGALGLDLALVVLERAGLRHSAARAGIWTVGPGLDACARALRSRDGLEQSLRLLHATGVVPLDLPACLGGLGRERGKRIKNDGCAACVRDSICAGAPERVAQDVTLGPRPLWRGIGAGATVAIVKPTDLVFVERTLPGLIDALRAEQCEVVTDENLAEADLVLTTDLALAARACDARALPILALDLHCMRGIERLHERFLPPGRRPEQGGWWPENLSVVSCFPSFAHLYVAQGVPLSRVVWRPYPIDAESCGDPSDPLEADRIFCGGNHLRDWKTLERAAALLGPDTTPIDVYFPVEHSVARIGPLRPIGYVQRDEFVDAIARSRFVILPALPERNHPNGGTVIALALALGKPVVASWTPMAHDHLRNGFDSLIVSAGDPAALADAIRSVDQDRNLRAKLSAGAKSSGRAASAQSLAREIVRGGAPETTWPHPLTGGSPWYPWPCELTPKRTSDPAGG